MNGLPRFAYLFYRVALSPFLHFLAGPQTGCRFTPTCGEYAVEAFSKNGIARGTGLVIKRISKCHPWGRVE